jgi:hypothetical protein
MKTEFLSETQAKAGYFYALLLVKKLNCKSTQLFIFLTNMFSQHF